MATIDNYTVNINVKGDQDLKNASTSATNLGKSLNDLSSGGAKNIMNIFGDGSQVVQHFGEKVNGLRESAEHLAVALVGIGIVEYVRKIGDAAAQTKDLSEAFGLQISTVLELQAGFQRAGRDADAMAKMMTTLNQKALEAADGNLKVKNAFAELGVTFNDLKTMSMDQIMLKIGKAMEEGKGSAESIAAAMEVLGKGAKAVPWGDFVQGVERAQGKMGEAAHGVEQFDIAMKALEQNAADVRREFMVLITPVVEFFNKLTEGQNNAKLAAEALAGAMTIFTAGALFSGIKTLVGVVSSLVPAFGATAIATEAATAATVGLTASEMAMLRVNAAVAVARAEALAAVVAETSAKIRDIAVTEADVVATAELVGAKRALMLASGQLALAQGAAAGATAGLAAAEAASVAPAVAATAATRGLAGAVGMLSASLAAIAPLAIAAGAALALLWPSSTNEGEQEALKQIKALEDALASLPKAQQEAYFKLSDEDKKRVNAQLISMAEMKKNAEAMGKVVPGNKPVLDSNKKELDQQAAGRAALLAQYEVQVLQTVQSEKRLKLQADIIGLGELEKTQKLAAYDAEAKKQMEILKLQQQIHQVEVQAANDPEGAAKYAGQLTIMRNQLTIVSKQVDKTAELTTQLKAAEQAQQKYLFGQQLSEKALMNVASIQDEINQLTMTGDQQKMASIQRVIEAEARAEIKRREALLGNNQKLDWLEQIDILHQVEKAYDPVLQKQKELTEQSRSFETGWNRAYNSYMDDATNASKRAGDMFTGMTNRMNSAIDNFVETGKFSFEDFARSVIQDLIKIELKAQATQIMKAVGGSGGIFSAIGSMLGFADGGDPPVGKPSIVGENGPEVFIPKTAGTIMPNDKIGGSVNNVTNHYITNNISAIDSKSVAQLFAENRKTLLGTVQLAQKELPYGNR